MSQLEIRLMKQELDNGQELGPVVAKRFKRFSSITQMESVADLLIEYMKDKQG